jgi:hypothetical protein
MNAHKANLIHAVTLMGLSIWLYFGSSNPSMTSLIPFIFGVILLSLNNGILYRLKGQTRAALTITIAGGALWLKLLSDAFLAQNQPAIMKIGVMTATCLLSIYYFFKSSKF